MTLTRISMMRCFTEVASLAPTTGEFTGWRRQGSLGSGELSRMLSRSAEDLYWMGRYLERAQHLSCLLRVQTETLVDRPVDEIHFGWLRMYGSLDRQPPVGSLELLGQDDYSLADSYTLADDLTFERSQSGLGLERRRQRTRIRPTGPPLSYRRNVDVPQSDLSAHVGSANPGHLDVVARALLRGNGGRHRHLRRRGGSHDVPRRRLALHAARSFSSSARSCRLPFSRRRSWPPSSPQDVSEAAWTSLLRLYHALEVYDRTYSLAVKPRQVLNLLVTDPRLPDSLYRSLEVLSAELTATAPQPERAGQRCGPPTPGPHGRPDARRLAGPGRPHKAAASGERALPGPARSSHRNLLCVSHPRLPGPLTVWSGPPGTRSSTSRATPTPRRRDIASCGSA